MAKDLQADAVLEFNLQFCQTYGVESYFIGREMEERGIPYLHLATDFSEEDQGQLLTRIEALLEMIRS